MVRLKNRWLLFEIVFEDTLQRSTSTKNVETLSSKDVYSAIKDSIKTNFGDYGVGCVAASLNVKYFSPFTNIGVLRVSRDHYHIAWGAMTFISQIKTKNCLLRVLYLGATIKQCQLSAIDYDRDQILLLKRQAELHDDAESLDVDELLEQSKSQILAIE
ncbi:2275_t:CDS:2 [Funneliformis mosseae]|uniref:Ribonuclease P/MRP protein subunit POP5 n=1 Tax=Funneliformis mosseae TaxID=27381 RepID=A0A9N8V3Z8_FUNMO|nr:2275_t:CDS:2 [Funneliformis mosseae]